MRETKINLDRDNKERLGLVQFDRYYGSYMDHVSPLHSMYEVTTGDKVSTAYLCQDGKASKW